MEEDDFFETNVGRLKVLYKLIGGKPVLWWIGLENNNIDPSKIAYEIEFAKAKEDARKFFRNKKK